MQKLKINFFSSIFCIRFVFADLAEESKAISNKVVWRQYNFGGVITECHHRNLKLNLFSFKLIFLKRFNRREEEKIQRK